MRDEKTISSEGKRGAADTPQAAGLGRRPRSLSAKRSGESSALPPGGQARVLYSKRGKSSEAFGSKVQRGAAGKSEAGLSFLFLLFLFQWRKLICTLDYC